MARLTNIKAVGRFKNTDNGKVVNVKKGRKVGYGTTILFYLHMGSRVYISDRDFYGGIWKEVLVGN